MSVIPSGPVDFGFDMSSMVITIMGLPRSGKTTLACNGVPGTLLLATEQKYQHIPPDGLFPVDAHDVETLQAAIKELRGRPDIKRVVVDTYGHLRQMFEEYACRKLEVERIGDMPHGQGYGYAKDAFAMWFSSLLACKRQLVLLCHTQYTDVQVEGGRSFRQQKPLLGGKEDSIYDTFVRQRSMVTFYLEKQTDPATTLDSFTVVFSGREDLEIGGNVRHTAKLPRKFNLPTSKPGEPLPPGWSKVEQFLRMAFAPDNGVVAPTNGAKPAVKPDVARIARKVAPKTTVQAPTP